MQQVVLPIKIQTFLEAVSGISLHPSFYTYKFPHSQKSYIHSRCIYFNT